MEIDWGQALQIGGIGFGMVFVVLTILAITVWLIGLLLMKMDAGHKKAAAGEIVSGKKDEEENGE